MIKGRLTSQEILDLLGDSIGSVLQVPARRLGLIPISAVVPRADASSAYRIVGPSGRSLAVLLCSPPEFPGMVERAMRCSALAKRSLAPTEAEAILDPLLEGRLGDVSYAMLRYCQPLAENRLVWRFQRGMLREPLLQWLRRANESTVNALGADEHSLRFGKPLAYVAAEPRLNSSLREDASRALQRLTEGSWQPRYVLMHGDLWKGNILVDQREGYRTHQEWRNRFVLVDWAGSLLRGYPFFDLLRLAASLKMPNSALGAEVRWHCEALEIDKDDSTAYLLAALGHIALNLGEFPIDQFISMAHTCHHHLRQGLRTSLD